MRVPLLACLWLVAVYDLAHAIEWGLSGVTAAQEAGLASAVAVDRAGQVHIVYVEQTASGQALRYVLRSNRPAGFDAPSTLSAVTGESTFPVHLAIDVSPAFTVQVAVVNAGGAVLLYEQEQASPGSVFARRDVTTGASAANTGGVSIVAQGNGFSRTSLAFTAADGSARFTERLSSTVWRAAAPVTSGANSGLAPKLLDRSGGLVLPNPEPYAVITYNDVTKNVQESRYSLASASWQSPRVVAPAPSFSRLDADAHRGKIGVAYAFSQNGTGGAANIRDIRFAEWNGSSWSIQTATQSSELGSELELFGRLSCRYDGDGHALLVYTREAFLLITARTLDVRFRRFTPGLGWGELSIVEAFATGSTYTNSLSFDVHDSGDPAVIYERDPGAADSTLVFARPFTSPWVMATEDSVASHTFAPALATGASGATYLVTGAANNVPGTLGERSYLPPRLTTLGPNSRSTIALPSSNTPHLANAVTATPDGAVHVVTLNVAATGATTGALLYYRILNGVVSGPVAVDDNGAIENLATRDSLALDHDASGRLYLAFQNAGAGLSLLTLPPRANLGPGQRPWETIVSLGGSYTGIDLAARPDGGVLVTCYNTATRRVLAYANFDAKTANRLPAYMITTVFGLATDETPPKNTSCSIDALGRPRIAVGLNNTLVLVGTKMSSESGDPYLPVYYPGYQGARVELLSRGQAFHLIAHTNLGSGLVLIALSGEVGRTFDVRAIDEFSTTGLGLSALGSALAATFDANGFPIIAAPLFSGGFPLFTFFDDVVLARPADGLDLDGDGVALITEHAYCMNPNVPDAELNLTSTIRRIRLTEGVIIEPRFTHRYPAVRKTPLPTVQGVDLYGEMLYEFQLSTDIARFVPFQRFTPDAGLMPSVTPIPSATPGVAEQVRGLRISAAYRDPRPDFFVRYFARRFR